jgi:hypothetical protein
MNNKSLVDLQKEFNFKTDKGSVHSYLEQYDKLFKKFKYKKINVLEIGIASGESLKLWSKYFLNATIYGIDIFTRKNKAMENVKKNISNFDNIKLFNVNSYVGLPDDIKSRNDFFDSIGDTLFHVIIDDGNHWHQWQIETFKNFTWKPSGWSLGDIVPVPYPTVTHERYSGRKNVLHQDGIYIIEDIHEHTRPASIATIQRAIPEIRIITTGKNFDDTLGIYGNE